MSEDDELLAHAEALVRAAREGAWVDDRTGATVQLTSVERAAWLEDAVRLRRSLPIPKPRTP